MKRILIADDEPHIARLLKLNLERAGYTVDVANNGRVAFERIQVCPPDVLVTDIQMPVMTGQELCTRIHEEMPEREFMIFVATSRTEIEHREWSSKIGNLTFLEKPISIRTLLARLDDYFESNFKTQGGMA